LAPQIEVKQDTQRKYCGAIMQSLLQGKSHKHYAF